LLHAQTAPALASRAGNRLRACFGTTTLALLASDQCRHADRRLFAAERLLERHLEIITQVAAAILPSPTAHDLAEHLVEDVGKATGGEAETTWVSATLLKGGMAEAIIGGTLLIVFKDVVSFVEVLEFLLGVLVAGIAIGVMLHCELAISSLEFVGAARLGDPECFVKVLFRHDRQGVRLEGLPLSLAPAEDPPGWPHPIPSRR